MRLTFGDPFPYAFFDGAKKRILELQREDGAIPWFNEGTVDPWNHVEAAMGLTLLGETEAARRAFDFLANTQLADGSWWGELGAIIPLDERAHYVVGSEMKEKPIRDTNFTAYIATGAWHHYLVTRDRLWLAKIWPCVEKATHFVLAHQSEHGDIRWAANDPRTPEDDALISGCSSIYKSLECAANMARELGAPDWKDWMQAREALGNALRTKPHRFDRTWASKERFSMDWYYPVLTGVITGEAARKRLAEKWSLFIAEGKGCRCVHDAPWVTIAESAELTLALLAAGERHKAEAMLEWQHQWRDEDGAYWMGHQFESKVAWPAEKPAWTAAAIILAADAVTGASAASHLFAGKALAEAAE